MRKPQTEKSCIMDLDAHQALGTAGTALAYARTLGKQYSDERITTINIQSSINSFQFWCKTIIKQIIKQ